MSNPSRYQSHNFSISMFDRLTNGGNWIRDIDISAQSWKHTISAFGGFDTASFDIIDTQAVLDDWVQNGLFRPIITYDPSLTPIWEGFVNSITINKGGLSLTLGPVTDVANRIFAVYSTVDTTKNPPEIGVRKNTATINELSSQAIWGIWHEIVSLAGVTDANADQLVAGYLKEHSTPERSSNFNFSLAGATLSIECAGWYKTLVHPFNYTANSGTIDLSTRIQELITSQLNPWVSTNYSRILANTTQVKRYQNSDQIALEQIKGLTAMGDSNNNRHIFGIYENRQAVYELSSSIVDYEMRLDNTEQHILDPGEAIVYPWQIRPGKYAFFSDFMPGLGVVNTDLQQDLRTIEIEQVQFDVRLPFSVQLTGGHTSKYEQKSARLGLRGMDV